MNILFINPNYPEKAKSYLILPSLEISIMSSLLEIHGHKTFMLDLKIDDLDYRCLRNRLTEYKFDVVCIESVIQDHCEALKIIKEVKNLYPKVPIVLRGEITSFLPRETLEHCPELDIAMRFENEFTFLNLVKSIENNEQLFEIPNIAFRDTNKNIVVTNLEEPIKNLDLLPLPNRELWDIKKYYRRSLETIVRSTRGCPGGCKFCNKTKLAPFREFSINRFCDEIENLIKLGFNQFFFSDDSFSYSEKRIEDFVTEVKKRNLKIKFTSNMRIVDITEKKIKLLKEAGAYRFFVGVETVNSASSKLINKNIHVENIKKKLQIIKDYGLEFHASFIIGSPGDTKSDLESTIEFIKEIKPTLISANQLKPIPGTDIYNYPEKYGVHMPDPFWFERDEWTEGSICSTDSFTAEEIMEWKKKVLLSYMFI